MTGDTVLDYIPEYLSEDAKRKLCELAQESAPEPAPLAVNEYLIRHWCETLEDGNPLYLDADYARAQGFRNVVAPPGSVMTTFAMHFRWPWPPGEREPVRHIHYDIKEALNLPVGIITQIEMENHVPLQVGDRVSVSQRLVSISPWKKARVGEGHFWVMDRLYRNQKGELIVRERMTAFGYGRQEGAPPVAGSSQGGWSPAVEEVIQGDKTGYKARVFRDRFWEEVEAGEELPKLDMPITFTRCIYLASATRDFSPQHSNREYAQQRSKTKDIFVNTPFNMGMISRFMTDWGGPRSTVRRMNIAMRGNVCAGDGMIITGKVTKKYITDGEHRVDLEIVIATQDGPVTPCTATLALPSRAPNN
ncbi:MAG: MaoC family dehydratase N-terminal domain-containing protein [Deltaproteobacteria bacterium]|nr:MaoC family dehydratase N-terminal domain-containing protein [Deltaproteobacteria bacterium]